jgi:hypothetical protein
MFTGTSRKLEERQEPRQPQQFFVRIKPLDDEDANSSLALTVDLGEHGLALLSYVPLPIGTPILIEGNPSYIATGEVADWEWDYDYDLARMGIILKEQQGILNC